MNSVVLMGRLTTDPDIRYTQGENSLCIARFTLAVDRRVKKNGEQNADFIRCAAFGKIAEHIEKYYSKGLKVCLSGRIQTGSYTNNDGQKVFTTEVAIESTEFAESRNVSRENSQGNSGRQAQPGTRQTAQSQKNNAQQNDYADFMNIPDGIDEELPFS